VSSDDIARWVTIAKDVMTGIATIAAAVVATMGLHTWKRQLFGNSNYELSRRLLRSAYRLREAIQFVRNPLMLAGRWPPPERPPGWAQRHPLVRMTHQWNWHTNRDGRKLSTRG
jgi:hypothetical protein